jgi:SAM-dependent methyltransferase
MNGAEVLDLGAGRGADSLWLARQGIAVTAYDYAPEGLSKALEVAQNESLPLEVRPLNLTERRSVFAEGARLAHSPRPRVILANHVVDATSATGRESIGRLCSMALREGGRLFAQFYVVDDESVEGPEWMVGKPNAEAFVEVLKRYGASRVELKTITAKGLPAVRVMGVW